MGKPHLSGRHAAHVCVLAARLCPGRSLASRVCPGRRWPPPLGCQRQDQVEEQHGSRAACKAGEGSTPQGVTHMRAHTHTNANTRARTRTPCQPSVHVHQACIIKGQPTANRPLCRGPLTRPGAAHSTHKRSHVFACTLPPARVRVSPRPPSQACALSDALRSITPAAVVLALSMLLPLLRTCRTAEVRAGSPPLAALAALQTSRTPSSWQARPSPPTPRSLLYQASPMPTPATAGSAARAWAQARAALQMTSPEGAKLLLGPLRAARQASWRAL